MMMLFAAAESMRRRIRSATGIVSEWVKRLGLSALMASQSAVELDVQLIKRFDGLLKGGPIHSLISTPAARMVSQALIGVFGAHWEELAPVALPRRGEGLLLRLAHLAPGGLPMASSTGGTE